MSLTGEKASSGYATFSLGGLVTATMAMMPMFDTQEGARPTRNNICATHKVQLKQQWHCPECNGTPPDTTKAVNVAGVGWVEAPDSEWQMLAADTSSTFELGAWARQIDPVYFSGASYFLFPNEKKEVNAYVVIMELLRKEGGYLLATTTGDHGTARVTAVSYHDPSGFLIAQHCHHKQYLRVEKAARIASTIDHEKAEAPVKPAHYKIAKQAFKTLPETFDLEAVRDTLGEAQYEYVKKKAAGMGVRLITEPADLMEALKATSSALKSPRKRQGVKA